MGFTVLIVDDELMPRTVLCRRLPWAGLGVSRVEQASDGEEGLEQARQCRPDIVISDIKMPRKNGFWAYSTICTIGFPQGIRQAAENAGKRGFCCSFWQKCDTI